MLGTQACTGTEAVALGKSEAGPWPRSGLEGTAVPGLGAESPWEGEPDLPAPSQGPIFILRGHRKLRSQPGCGSMVDCQRDF